MAITVLNAPPQPSSLSAAALGWTDALDYCSGDGVADDTTGLLAAVAATDEGGTLYLPPGEYKITAPVVIDKAMTVKGGGCHELWGSVLDDGLSCTIPIQDPYIKGAVIVPSTGGADCIQVTVAGLAVHLKDFGIRFASGIRWSNTGHGIQMRPPTVTGGRDNGVEAGTIENVTVHGHDGNHYAFDIYNPIMCTFRHMRSYGGGHVRVTNISGTVAFDGVPINYGNLLFEHCYGVLMLAGSAHGIELIRNDGILNLMQFNRQQIWARGDDSETFFGVTGPNSAVQKMLKLTPISDIKHITFIQPDFETNMNLNLDIPTQGVTYDNAGVISGPGGGQDTMRPSGYNFGDRTDYRGWSWKFENRIIQPVGGSEKWGYYDQTGARHVLAAETGAALGGAYVGAAVTTAQRPAAGAGVNIGLTCFDTTIGKQIWWNGTNWKDAAGTTV